MALDIPRQTLSAATPAGVNYPRVEEALAFDDVLVVPAYSQVLPSSTSTVTRLTRGITLNIPLISAAMDTVTAQYGRLDIGINNAGIGLVGDVTETNEEDYDRLMGVNVKGVFLCAQAEVRWMKEHGGGAIINTSSVAGLVAGIGLSSALKAAGITGVKIAGGQPEPTDLSAVQSGGESAAVLDNNVMRGWIVIDTLARTAEGMTVPPNDGGQPAQILTKSNVNSTDINTYAVPANYQQLYMKLWKIS